MTREEFIESIEKKTGFYYELEGDKIIIPEYCEGIEWDIESITSGVEFRNSGGVILNSLKEIPSGTKFYNKGWVSLNSIKHVSEGVKFYNSGGIEMDEVVSISPGVEFHNKGIISMSRLIKIDRDSNWTCGVSGIDDRRILNAMIKKGVFLR